MRPQLGIVMPVFDTKPAWLFEAVDSVAERAGVAFELIVVDDGSTASSTIQALRVLEERGITVLRTANSGPSAARNRGVEAMTAPYVLPLDSDDRLGEGFCAPAVKLLDSDPDVSVVAGATQLFGERTTRIRIAPRLSLADFLLTNRVSVTSVFRREDWRELGGFDEGLRAAYEDHEWWVRVLSLGGICVGLSTTAVEYRIGHESAHTRADDMAKDMTRASIVRNNEVRLQALLNAAFQAIDMVQPSAEQIAEQRRERDISLRYAAIDRLLGKLPGARRLAVEFNHLLDRRRKG